MMSERSLASWWRALDGVQRVLTIATAILGLPLFGQLVSLRDLTTSGHNSALAILLMALSIFVLPTSLILVAVIAATARAKWREHRGLLVVCLLDVLICGFLIWYFVDSCGWMNVFGLVAHVCR